MPPITHAKVSGKADSPDTDLVRPSDWNDDHAGSAEILRETGGPTELPIGVIAAGEFLQRVGATVVGAAPPGGLYSDYIHIRDEKASGVNGGGFTLGAWRTRDLTVELDDTGGDAELGPGGGGLLANQIRLEAGTYRCRISCPAFRVDNHKARLQNITDAATLIVGTSEYAAVLGEGGNSSFILGRFTLLAQKVLEVQHYCVLTHGVTGFGIATGIGGVIEVYTEVELWKEA